MAEVSTLENIVSRSVSVTPDAVQRVSARKSRSIGAGAYGDRDIRRAGYARCNRRARRANCSADYLRRAADRYSGAGCDWWPLDAELDWPRPSGSHA